MLSANFLAHTREPVSDLMLYIRHLFLEAAADLRPGAQIVPIRSGWTARDALKSIPSREVWQRAASWDNSRSAERDFPHQLAGKMPAVPVWRGNKSREQRQAAPARHISLELF